MMLIAQSHSRKSIAECHFARPIDWLTIKWNRQKRKKKQILIENMSSGGAEIGWIRHMNERKMNEK